MSNLRSLATKQLVAFLLSAPEPADAAFHRWEINELYTSPDGSVQFVELFAPFDGQEFTTDKQIVASQTGHRHLHGAARRRDLSARC